MHERPGTDRSRLQADCPRCFALCCVGPAFAASSDFAISKPAGQPCPNLLAEFGCGIHDRLRGKGFAGCAVFDCFGAGQRLAQETFGGRDWRRNAELAPAMFAALSPVRQLHELLWYLAEVEGLGIDDESLRDRAGALAIRIDTLAGADPDALLRLDVAAERAEVAVLLGLVSGTVRHAERPDPADHAGADLVGARLRGADLRAATLRGALALGADLSGADLRRADLLGCDLRGADLSGADLRGALFVVPSQLAAANGDAATHLPQRADRPAHW